LVLDEEPPPEPDPIDEEVSDDLLTDTESESSLSQPEPEEPTESALPLDMEEFEDALLEEARDGELGPGEEEDLSLVDEQPPPTREMEEAFLEEALDAQEPPEPVAEAPAPPLEETMEERDLSEEEALDEPPPPETSDVSTGVLPPRPHPIYLGEPEPLAAYDVQTIEDVEWLELPDRELTPEEEKLLLRRYGLARLRTLDKEITKTYNQVTSEVGENEDLATDCYNQLLKARDIVLRRQASKIPQAEYYVEQAQALLKRASRSERGAKKYAWWITGWGFVWGALFLVALVALNVADFAPADAGTTTLSLAEDIQIRIFLESMIWGGIGGVVAVWYSLFKHVGRRDFDTQYNLTYVGKPFLGLVLGATVYMLFHLMLTLGILPAGLQESGQSGTATFTTVTPWIIYPLAWACGFKENRIFDLVDRVMKRIFSGEKSSESEPAPEAEAPTA
jgi:hypothetical protein